MYYPREEKRDFLTTLSTLSLIAIVPLAILALLSNHGATSLFMLLGNQQAQASITEIHNTPNSDLNIITYRYDADGISFTDTYTQNRQHDPAAYAINDTIPLIHSTWAPSVKMTQAAYDASGTDAKIFLGCTTAILLLLGLSFFALVRQRKHAAEDFYY
ncbi:hypothetical protein SAMN05216600_101114 [Pseudomonas cuatrocienegasensis]|uniref:DUF3592 domain-containing protein n=1 Tax=Pseudomonas cuatrocienegasensis TaxID=543360 RepID=A0ABY1B0A8_9PSED|nr:MULTISPECIES: hypothetical protein [Pseudomonas]OEC36148.1 hypothetical protein A7D25_06015 [Pseudomonas sp. 21C1]SEP62089.1 hypothetical protein SAMN05216600_101114 [Pseudomonas cuatrocienegasensis]